MSPRDENDMLKDGDLPIDPREGAIPVGPQPTDPDDDGAPFAPDEEREGIRDEPSSADSDERQRRTVREMTGPTADEPLRGLKHLASVATVGRDRILALAAEQVVYAWQDIAVAGTITMIAGRPGEGKTTLLFLLVAARANVGEPRRMSTTTSSTLPRETWTSFPCACGSW